MTTVIIVLAILTLLLGVIEIFFTPGFGVAGICSIGCALVDVALVYQQWGTGWAVAALIAGIVLLTLVLRWLAHSRTFDRMALHNAIESTAATHAQLSVKHGDEGVALTRLALVGNARLGDKVVEVKSSGEFIEPGTPVRVIQVNEAQITVERCKA